MNTIMWLFYVLKQKQQHRNIFYSADTHFIGIKYLPKMDNFTSGKTQVVLSHITILFVLSEGMHLG